AGYALSPIDLIPDFVPVLGYMDDVIIVPLGILIVVKMIPPEIMAEHRALAAAAQARPGRPTAGKLIAVLSSGTVGTAGWLCYRAFARSIFALVRRPPDKNGPMSNDHDLNKEWPFDRA